jgi:hypothetical protein
VLDYHNACAGEGDMLDNHSACVHLRGGVTTVPVHLRGRDMPVHLWRRGTCQITTVAVHLGEGHVG